MDMRSEARISKLMIDHDLEKNGDKFQIYPIYTSEFLVPLKIGTPTVPQILIMDTGSLLLWVHCGPTIGGEGSPGRTEGNLASEVVTFDSSNGTEVTINRLMFGCSSKYSRDYDSNTLVLGGEPIIIAASTPMFMLIGKYYITLEKISVGDKFLDIDPNIFKRVDYQGGMLVDSWAPSTYLPDVAFNKLKEEIRSVIGTTLKEYISSRPNELCYLGTIIQDVKNLLTIAFHFVENAKMKFATENLFRQDEPDHFCLSVQSADSSKLPFSILGVWAQ
ncbi:aspartic proteinase nepenthesin-1-like [Solanum dulcamara]|uniref:aspartic proteinase nepenthesin-1-like n=1 Tax=Solanum dulcamara TaxID=45834 RepID=UPI0024863464|nr:aspartic proteinase nepenthesin-1-like [Solanum dulcamara]